MNDAAPHADAALRRATAGAGSAAAPRWSLAGLAIGPRAWALLILLCCCLYLPGIAAMPPLDRDEARFVQATRQMLESGDFLHIRFQNEARNKKPAGIYWLQAAAVAATGNAQSTQLWPYRLPSFFGALAAVLLTFRMGESLVGREAAFAGAALLAASLALTVEAHLAKTDAVLLATIVAAQGALAAIWCAAQRGERTRWPTAALFWAAQGVSILVKGPVGPLVGVLTVLALSFSSGQWRWLARLRPLRGLVLAALIVLPWLIAIEVATGGGFLGEAVGHDLLGKVAGAQESHGAPPGSYAALAFVTFWPGSLFLAAGVAWAWRRRHEPAARFLLAWLLPAWLLFEAVPTKLPHYVLPLYPALALLCGAAVIGQTALRRRLEAASFLLWALVGIGIAAGIVALPFAIGSGLAPLSLVPAAAIAIMIVAAWRGRRPLALAAVVLVFAPVFAFVLPGLDHLWVSREAATMVRRHLPESAGPVAIVGYREPSVVFLLGTETRLVGPDQAAAELAQHQSAAVVVADRDEPAFRQSLAARHAEARPIDHIDGFNYSRGRPITLTLYVPGS